MAVVYLHHRELSEQGIVAVEARRFPYATVEEAVAQALHDLARVGTAPLVDSIRESSDGPRGPNGDPPLGALIHDRKALVKMLKERS